MNGEFDFIRRIRRRALKRSIAIQVSNSSLIAHRSSLVRGIGDDAAIFRQAAGFETVITADLLVEEIDFRLETMPPSLLGHKALAVSLSDIAGMGARPRFSLLSIGIPQTIWRTDFVDQFYAGFFALADRHEVALIGGDVSRTPEHIIIDSILLGEAGRGQAVLRTGARPGDYIFVTGTLGGSAAGLQLLEHGARLEKTGPGSRRSRAIEGLLLRHLKPEARVEWGALLGDERLASAMIDVSDGLSSDLMHLCQESGVGAIIEGSRLPVDPLIEDATLPEFPDPLALALDGGEDFELLFTVHPRKAKRLPAQLSGVPVTFIGEVTDAPGRVRIAEQGRVRNLRAAGFDHFR